MASLSQDLTNIRKGQKKSIKDIFESSRIPVHIIEQIENGRIFSNFATNQVYLRSFIRTYAKALKIDDKDISKALEQHERKKYTGFLGEKYSDENTEKKSEEPKKPLVTDTSKNPQEQLGEDGEEPGKSEPTKNDDEKKRRRKVFSPESLDLNQGKSLRDIEEEDQEVKKRQHTSTALADSASSKINKTDWAQMVKKGMMTKQRKKQFVFLSIIFSIAIVAAVIWIINSDLEYDEVLTTTDVETGDRLSAERTPAVTADTYDAEILLDDETATEPEERTGAPIPISERDSLEILVYAYVDKLEPFFMGTSDGTANSPYWIEQGMAMRIKFANEINIRGQYSRMMLIFNGRPIENFMDFFGDNRTVSIPRSFFEEDEKWLYPPSEDEINIEMPTEIIDRP